MSSDAIHRSIDAWRVIASAGVVHRWLFTKPSGERPPTHHRPRGRHTVAMSNRQVHGRRRAIALIIVTGVVVVAAACGSNDDGGGAAAGEVRPFAEVQVDEFVFGARGEFGVLQRFRGG